MTAAYSDFRIVLLCCAVGLPLLSGSRLASAEENAAPQNISPGQTIWSESCAYCHGENGEGTEEYSSALIGDKSVAQLTELITKTMPEGDAESIIGSDAEAVAAWMHDAFYSPAAQLRNNPPRLQLARLTALQHQYAVMDLFAEFRGRDTWADERVVEAEYFASGRSLRNDKRFLERKQPTLGFTQADAESDAFKGKLDGKELSARFQGSILAPQTGDYTFTLETPNAGRVWINTELAPQIDRWVKSGDQTRYETRIRLVEGRLYPVRVEWFKTKQQKEASVRLLWTPPSGVEESIPTRLLNPVRVPEKLVLTTPFPADDKSTGFVKGTSISKEWLDAVTWAAVETADWIVGERLDRYTWTKEKNISEAEKLKLFAGRVVERAFRRPITEDERVAYVDRQFEGISDPRAALKRTLILTFASPQFLYRERLQDGFTPYDVASWLAFSIWDSVPDQRLLGAAARNALRNEELIRNEARRMLHEDIRGRAKAKRLLKHWVGAESLHDLHKDAEKFPDFDEQVAADLHTSLDLFFGRVLTSESADFRELLTSNRLELNGRLAQLYGVDLPADADFQTVSVDDEPRVGVLTHPLLLAGHSYMSETSPIHRGVYLSRSILGRFLKPPPIAVSPTPADLHPDLTVRERVAIQTKPQACATCHSMINPLGFALEEFDAIGRHRTNENGKPIDAAGHYEQADGTRATFIGAKALSEFVTNLDRVPRAFADQLAHDMTGDPPQAYRPELRQGIQDRFLANGYNINELLIDAVTATALERMSLGEQLKTETAQVK